MGGAKTSFKPNSLLFDLPESPLNNSGNFYLQKGIYVLSRGEKMIVRMASAYNPEIRKAVQRTQEVAPVFRHLLMPVAVAGYSLAGWRLGADLEVTGEFFVSRGLFSHWQVWLALAVGTHLTATYLNRVGRSDDHGITA